MIEDIPKEFFHSITFRYASQEDSMKVLLEMDLQPETIGDMLAFLRDRHRGDSLESLLDKPFEPKPQLTPQPTRFSDGTIRVFYKCAGGGHRRSRGPGLVSQTCVWQHQGTAYSLLYELLL